MLAVYTTIYPGVEPYLANWAHSLCQQTDQDFDLWIGLDSLQTGAVQRILGSNLKVNWVVATPGATPAQIRQEALTKIIESYSTVVLVDSDDLLHPTRVAAAREYLQNSDLVGCALRLVDQEGKDLGLTFGMPPQWGPEDVFPRNNVFGFSNSAYRSDVLRRCLPIPASAVLVDWFIATRAWLLGAKLTFDAATRMDYRQHSTNTARVRYPISGAQVISDTALVRRHFELLLGESRRNFLPDREAALERVAADVEEFAGHVLLHPTQLDRYVKALNILQPPPLWWSCVAYPSLRNIWMQS
jgi:hypothetical protein